MSRINPGNEGSEVSVIKHIRQLQITVRAISEWNSSYSVHTAYEGVKGWIKKNSEITLLPPCTKYASDLFWETSHNPKFWEPSIKAKFEAVLSEEEYKILMGGNNKR